MKLRKEIKKILDIFGFTEHIAEVLVYEEKKGMVAQIERWDNDEMAQLIVNIIKDRVYDKPKVWGKIISEDEVKKLYNNGKPIIK